MPLKSIERAGDHQMIAIWEITEKLEELHALAAGLPDETPDDITHEVKLSEWYCTRILASQCAESYDLEYFGMVKDDYGKPWLRDHDVYFSVTHCHPHVAVIIDKLYPVGIDLERNRQQIRRISHRFLSQAEEAHSNDDEYLLICWAAKEALYKLHGRKSLEFRSQLLVSPFTPMQEGIIEGTIIDDGEELHELYYRFMEGGKYAMLHSLS